MAYSAPGRLLGRARRLAAMPLLPSRRVFAGLVSEARKVLGAEAPELRPSDSGDRPGGLVLLPDLPTILVPDLHARVRFLAEVLGWKVPLAGRPPRPAVELLAAGEINLVCLGDVFHSEWGTAARRWIAAYREYASAWAAHRFMDEEMSLTLSTVRLILETKIAYPRFFHYIKGNHDNISDEEGRGDHSFYKFVAEGEMVASWFAGVYGPELLAAYRDLELRFPLMVRGERFVASHAEPAFALRPGDVIEYHNRPDVVEALIWTPNDGAEPGSVAAGLESFLGETAAGSRGALWFGGHRPVEGRYALRAEGRYVQFHNPGRRQFLFLLPGRAPDPERDLVVLG